MFLCKSNTQDALDRAETLLDDMSDHYLAGKVRDAKSRADLGMVAANITEDRYSAGSTAARCVLVIIDLYGYEAAKCFMDDLDHHEH